MDSGIGLWTKKTSRSRLENPETIHKYMDFWFITKLALVLRKLINFEINDAGMIGYVHLYGYK